MQEKKSSIKIILLIFGLCSILFVCCFFLLNDNKGKQEIQRLYSIKVRGYKLDKEFDVGIYEYNLEVEDNFIDISCESNVNIDGCNVRLDLSDKEEYIHLIDVFYNNKKNTYKINITKKENKNDNLINIEKINGNPLEWTNEDITLEVLMEKEDLYLFSFDDGLTWQDSNKYVVSENGKYKLIVKKRDGLEMLSKLVEVDKIDKIKPTVIVNKFSFEDKVLIEVSSYDELSGIDGISFNGSDYSLKTKYEVNKKGKYYIEVKDKAGNISDKYYFEIVESDFKKEEPLKKYVVELNENGSIIENKSIYCETNRDSCEVILPNIFSNYEVIGWGDKNTSTEALYSPGQKIVLNNNLKLYAITKKEFTATFERNGVAIPQQKSLTCIAYNESLCEIKMPIIATFSNVVGWNTDKNATTAVVDNLETITLINDITFYPITKKEYTVNFEKNEFAMPVEEVLSCTAYNGKPCEIKAPEIITQYEIVGWNTNIKATTAMVEDRGTISVTNSTKYYPIIKKKNIAKFYSENLDYIESKELSCISYNGGSCEIILPYFNKKGHFNSFWSTDSVVMEDLGNKTKLNTYFLQAGKPYLINDDITLYPNFNHPSYLKVITEGRLLYKFRNISTIESENVKYGQSIFEFESGLNITTISKFKKFVSNLYNKFPWLFGPGKVFVVKRDTMKTYVDKLAYLSHGMNDAYFTIDLFDSTDGKNIDQNAVIHEMGHSWDKYYRHKKGKRMSELPDFDIVYNTVYDRLNVDADGIKMNKVEAFANLFSIYYWHLLGNDTTKLWYGLANDKVPLDENQQKIVKDFMDKYISISANGYR